MKSLYQKQMEFGRVLFISVVINCLMWVLIVSIASAEPGPSRVPAPADLWQGLIGEAVSEGEAGMTAVCWVYRNRLERGLPLGCVALKRRDLGAFVAKQGTRYQNMAKRVVAGVFTGQTGDPTGGADHYENVDRYGRPAWAKKMVITARIGAHTFFR